LADAKAAYGALGDAVRKVNGDLVTDDARLMWKELGMLLSNDAVEGGDAVDLTDAARVQAELQGHVARLARYYELKPQPKATAPAMAAMPEMVRQPAAPAAAQPAAPQAAAPKGAATAPVPAQFTAQFNGVWCVYRDMGAALAADDGAAAAKAVGQATGALAQVDMSPLQDQAMAAWMADLPRLKSDFRAASAAGQDLESLRAAFAPLSEDMAAAVKTFGVAPDESVYELHCPMAFGGKGANWLQPDKETHNPYFGQQMPKCGVLVATLAEKAGKKTGDGAHE